MLTLKGINVWFMAGRGAAKHVLRDLNLTVESGQFSIVIGGNGAGKSTLMNVIAGEIMPQSGQVILDGLDITRRNAAARSADIARVFQDPYRGSFASLSVEENLAIAICRGQRRPLTLALEKAARVRFRDAVAMLGIGLENRLSENIEHLSGGQRQAVALLMATLQPSKVLLLDEHTAALDPKMAYKVVEISNTLIRQQRLTTLMITHSMKQAMTYGDETILLDQGKIARRFKKEEFSSLPADDLIQLFG